MKILVLGAGGVGGYFGGRMAEAGLDVTFLVRERRKHQLINNGLLVESKFGNISLSVKVITDNEIDCTFDLVLMSCKAYDLDIAINSILPAMGPDSVVLPVINGIRQIDVLREKFGQNNVLGGVCYVGANLDYETGIIEHFGDFHSIVFGEVDCNYTKYTHCFAELDAKVLFNIELKEKIMQTMWDKCAGQGALSSANIITRSVVGDITLGESGRQFLNNVFAEGQEICKANGYPMSQDVIKFYEKIFDTKGSPFATSMLRDLESGKVTEGEHIIGDLIKRADDHGISVPIMKCALAAIQTHEAKLLLN
ncbi:MAG: 2-dehydropantoate 2-reductase [Alphaproteobacteria bacterium]